LVNFLAADAEGDSTGLFILESNDPGGAMIEIPLRAGSREPPVAIPALRECDAQNLPPNCSNEADLAPLARVYLDGSQSFDPNPARNVVAYRWEVLEAPLGSDPALFDIQTSSTFFDMLTPLAGTYVVELTVSSDIGIDSLPTEQSALSVFAIPDSRLHIQMVWDHPDNDQDLHLVYADGSPRVYHGDYDCFWLRCRPSCAAPSCTPTEWFVTDPATPFAEANPRLDRDDESGLGPENINIDRPQAGTYHVYVHNYGLVNPIDVPTIVTVRIWIDGILRSEFENTLNLFDLWAVAKIVWLGDNTATVEPSDPQVGAIVQSLEEAPIPAGYDFGSVFH